MKRKRFTEEQIAFALRQAESGTAVVEITRDHLVKRFPDHPANVHFASPPASGRSLRAPCWLGTRRPPP